MGSRKTYDKATGDLVSTVTGKQIINAKLFIDLPPVEPEVTDPEPEVTEP